MVGDQVLLNAKNLATKVVSAVYKTKLRPRFIGPFTVVAKKGLDYTRNLPQKLRTHLVFYVSMLKPYRDPALVNMEALAPSKTALPRASACASELQLDHLSEVIPVPGRANGGRPRRKNPTGPLAHGAHQPHV